MSEKTKTYTISMLPSLKKKAEEDSVKIFGAKNVSGYIQLLITCGLKIEVKQKNL